MIREKKSQIKIVILADYSLDFIESMGGSFTHVRDLTEHLGKYSDLDIHIVTVSTEVEKDTVVERNGITIHYLTSPKMPRFFTCLTIDPYKTMRKVKELRPDIIHAHGTVMYGTVAGFLKKKYYSILQVYGIVSEERKSWRGFSGKVKGIVYSMLERYSLKRVDVVLVATPYVVDRIKKFVNGKIFVNPLGVRDDWFKIESAEKENRLLFVGGLEPRKGLEHLLKAVKIIKNKIPTVKLHVVGGVRKQLYLSELMGFVKSNNLERNVKFLGHISDDELKKEYGESSVFVLPSQEESQGLVLLEAMAVGKPVVATNIGGIPFVVKDNETGFLVGYGNAEELAERIIILLKNEKLRQEMGRKGRERAKEFSTEKNAENVYKLYKEPYHDRVDR